MVASRDDGDGQSGVAEGEADLDEGEYSLERLGIVLESGEELDSERFTRAKSSVFSATRQFPQSPT